MANRLGELRKSCGLSLQALAERVGTTNQQISHLEHSKRSLTVEWLLRLAAALDCHPWDIIEAVEPPSLNPTEEQMLQIFRALSPEQREALISLASSMTGSMADRRRRRD